MGKGSWLESGVHAAVLSEGSRALRREVSSVKQVVSPYRTMGGDAHSKCCIMLSKRLNLIIWFRELGR
jgi:hypothetical protein